MTFIRKISGVPYLDEVRLWAQVSQKGVPVPDRLREIMKLVGVRFFDEEPGQYNCVLYQLTNERTQLKRGDSQAGENMIHCIFMQEDRAWDINGLK